MVSFFEIFDTATVRLSASYTPTSIALLAKLVTISDWYQCQLTELTEEDILSYWLEPMKVKFLKYWREIPPSPSLHWQKNKIRWEVFEALILLKDWYDAECRLQDKSWMYQIDREETDASSSNVTSEGMPEVEVN
jgi:hypothetical protein